MSPSDPTTSTSAVTYIGSGLVFVNSFGAGVTTAYKNAIASAENFFQSHFTNAVTLNLKFDLGSLSDQFSAQNFFNPVRNVSLFNFVNAHSNSRNHLRPNHRCQFALTHHGSDPWPGVCYPDRYGQDIGACRRGHWHRRHDHSKQQFIMDLRGRRYRRSRARNLRRGMGRIGGLGIQIGWSGPMDLFRYSAGHNRDYRGPDQTYFSVDDQNLLLPYAVPYNQLGIYGLISAIGPMP
jgi:hypothetical protein